MCVSLPGGPYSWLLNPVGGEEHSRGMMHIITEVNLLNSFLSDHHYDGGNSTKHNIMNYRQEVKIFQLFHSLKTQKKCVSPRLVGQ